jgi:hypothetical protein
MILDGPCVYSEDRSARARERESVCVCVGTEVQ